MGKVHDVFSRPRTRGSLVIKIISVLLLIAACSLPVGVAYPTDASDADAIVTAPLLRKERSGTQLSLAGIGSLYWAARHPAQAWRVLLPIQPRVGPDVTADLKARCIVFTESPSGRGAGCYFDAPDNVMH